MSNGLNLGKQVGPLPMGGWIVVVAGGLGIAYMINRNAPRGDMQPLVEPGVGTGLVPAGAIIQPSPGQGEGQTEPEHNSAWGNKAVNWLITQGHDPGKSDAAVRKYLAAENLSLTEQALVNLAIVRFGLPPEPLPPVTVPEIPPEQTEPEFEGRPTLSFTASTPIKSGGRVALTGNARLGGKGAANPADRVVRITVYKSMTSNFTSNNIYVRFYIQANSKGAYSSTTGWGTNGMKGKWRFYEAYYKGNIIRRRVRYT